jgi:hypothetical protein
VATFAADGDAASALPPIQTIGGFACLRFRVELTLGAKERLEGCCNRVGMKQFAALSRMSEWFSEQNEMVQAAVMGLYPAEIRAEFAALILERMAGGKK